MKTITNMVREFFRAVGDKEGDLETPAELGPDRKELREKLHREEWVELCEAWWNYKGHETPCRDVLAPLAKEMADVVYVLVGTAIALGIDFDAVFAAVHESNMRKAGGPRRADGKVLKPEGWKPPDILGVLARQADRRCICAESLYRALAEDTCPVHGPVAPLFDTSDVEDDGDITVHPAVKP